MSHYTFWYGRSRDCGTKAADEEWLNNAEQSLRDNTWTKHLYIDGSGFFFDKLRKEAAFRLFGALCQNTSVSSFVFQNARLTPEMDAAFDRAMEENLGLKSLTLRNLSSSDDNARYSIPSSVFRNHHLESLTLSKTSLDLEASRKLSQMIRESASLHCLGLDAVDIDRNGLRSILAAIIMSRSLTTLKINSLEWSKQDLQRLLIATAYNRSIKTLELEGMKLDARDAHVLAKLLQRNTTVTKLSVRKNLLGAEALDVLVNQGVLRNKTLQTLQLSRNKIGKEGARHVASMIKESKTLEELCLVGCQFGKEGCQVVNRALRYNQSLSTIALDCNDICDSVKDLVDSLQVNTKITHVLDRIQPVLEVAADRPATLAQWKQVDMLLRANKVNRRELTSLQLTQTHMPFLLQGVGQQPDVFFHFFSNRADLFPARS